MLLSIDLLDEAISINSEANTYMTKKDKLTLNTKYFP
jgi:hypothetical protein